MVLRSASLVGLFLVISFPGVIRADDAKEAEKKRDLERARAQKQAEAQEQARKAVIQLERARLVQQQAMLEIELAESLARPGNGLNSLLKEVEALQPRGEPRVEIGLNEQLVRRLHFARRGQQEALDLLQRGDRLDWPPLLKDAAYAADRARIQKHLPGAIKQAAQGKVPPEAVREMDVALQAMRKRLQDQLRNANMAAAQYVAARRYLDGLGTALTALRDADALEYLKTHGSKPAAAEPFVFQGKTVTELVRFMAEKKLAFAPAKPEDRDAYRALQAALTSYRDELKQLPPAQDDKR